MISAQKVERSWHDIDDHLSLLLLLLTAPTAAPLAAVPITTIAKGEMAPKVRDLSLALGPRSSRKRKGVASSSVANTSSIAEATAQDGDVDVPPPPRRWPPLLEFLLPPRWWI